MYINTRTMVFPAQSIEALIGSATEYSKTSIELMKLKLLDTAAGTISATLAQIFVGVLLGLFFIFFNLGLALWLGQLLGQVYYGFFAVAGLYIVLGAVSYYFLLPWYRRMVCNFIIRQVLNNT